MVWLEQVTTLHLIDLCPLTNWPLVSRTFTAPFDRLKIFLITRQPDPALAAVSRSFGMKAITGAITKIYVENGVLGFWIGNGLSVAKILPESAIKFLSYESSVRWSCSRRRSSDVNHDRRNGCLPRTGTTLRTLARSAGSAGSCREASGVSQVNSVCNLFVDVGSLILILDRHIPD